MASRQTKVIGGEGTSALTFTLAPGLFQYIQSVLVEVDTSGSGDVQPTLSVMTSDGVPVADKQQQRAIDGGGSGRATWALRLDDEPSGDYPSHTPRATIQRSALAAAQTVPSGGLATCTRVVQHDLASSTVDMTADVVSVPSRLICEVPGVYVIIAVSSWISVVATTVGFGIAVSGGTGLINSQDTRRAASTNTTLHKMAHVFVMDAGDIITQQLVQNSGAALPTPGSLLSAYRMGPQ